MKIFVPILAALLISLGVFFVVQRGETRNSENRQAIAELDKRIELAETEFTGTNKALRSELAAPVLPGLGSAAITNQIRRLEYLNAQNTKAKRELKQLKAERAQCK